MKLNSSGKLTCESNTEVRYGYIAGITMELQQKESGVWSTIKTWSDEDSTYIDLSKSYYVEEGYSYRLKLTHTALDSSGDEVEKVTDYSDTVDY